MMQHTAGVFTSAHGHYLYNALKVTAGQGLTGPNSLCCNHLRCLMAVNMSNALFWGTMAN